MTRYVVDAVTLLHLVDRGLSADPGHQLVAPNAIRSDALQQLLLDVRRGARTRKSALEVHERITEVKMRLLGDRASRGLAFRLALEHGWERLRDAEYVAVTRLQADALVTLDPDLAAKAAGVVPVTDVEALLVGS